MKGPRPLISREELATATTRLGRELSLAYADGVVLVAVLKGSVPFLADLVRAMSVVPVVDFLAISTYAPDTGRVRLLKDIGVDVTGRNVVIVEDIVDTGLTLTYLMGEMERRGARSVAACALLDKSARRIVPAPLRFVGFTIDDEYVIGYGLDFAERYRNLDSVFAADPEALAGDPDAYLDRLFGG